MKLMVDETFLNENVWTKKKLEAALSKFNKKMESLQNQFIKIWKKN